MIMSGLPAMKQIFYNNYKALTKAIILFEAVYINMKTCNIVTRENIYSVIFCHEMVHDSLVLLS